VLLKVSRHWTKGQPLEVSLQRVMKQPPGCSGTIATELMLDTYISHEP